MLTADFPRLRLLGLGLLPLPPGGPLEVAEEGAAHAHVEEEAGEDDGRAAPTAILLHKELGGWQCKKKVSDLLMHLFTVHKTENWNKIDEEITGKSFSS